MFLLRNGGHTFLKGAVNICFFFYLHFGRGFNILNEKRKKICLISRFVVW